MKKKINAQFLLIAAIAIVATAVCSILLSYRILKQQIFDDLRSMTDVVSMQELTKLPGVSEEKDAGVLGNLEKDGLRITWISQDGSVWYDSMEDAVTMENHKNRPEVSEAFKTGEGRDIRKSATSSKHTFYYAALLTDGSVLRIAKESAGIYHLLYNIIFTTIAIGGIIFVMCAVLSRRLTKRLMTGGAAGGQSDDGRGGIRV